ncbi:MAG: cyclic nucleotide-binding domain-containing protein [Planctomycetota bacterium]|nr:cyclic nucleotide-binding domain-containing protein [Planctomycetota bacterium]
MHLLALEWTPCIADIIHVANVIYLVSYCVRDIFWLRILTVIAGLCLLPYYFTCGDEPLWAAIAWNGLFTAVNLYNIFLIIRERWPRELHDAERALYDDVFSDLTPGEFVKLLGVGDWRDASGGETLVADGSVVEHMMVLAGGAAEVRKGDRVLAQLEPGQFVGEMSFLTGHKAGADVVTPSTARLMSWPQKDLEAFLDKNGSISFKVRGVLGRDVVTKLRAQA